MTSWLGTLVLRSNRFRVGLTIFLAGIAVFSVYTSITSSMDDEEGAVVDILPEKGKEAVAMPSLEGEKVAVVIIPQQNEGDYFLTPLTNQAILLLEDLEYTVVRVEGREDIHCIRASQVVLLYIGHGAHECLNTLFTTSGEQLCLAEIVENIEAERLIMLTNACFGGSWLEFQAENRLIISSVNNTYSLIVGTISAEEGVTCEVTIVDVIKWGRRASVENTFVVWEQWVTRFYQSAGCSGVHPVIYDGIPGDVWL